MGGDFLDPRQFSFSVEEPVVDFHSLPLSSALRKCHYKVHQGVPSCKNVRLIVEVGQLETRKVKVKKSTGRLRTANLWTTRVYVIKTRLLSQVLWSFVSFDVVRRLFPPQRNSSIACLSTGYAKTKL